ncbi:signal transduction histidine kinase [Paraburkholderia sp. GAS333]
MNNVTMARFIFDFRCPCAQKARRMSIRFATLSGCLIAFALLLCMFPAQANAASRVGAASTPVLNGNSSPAVEANQHGAVIPLPQPLDDIDAHEGGSSGPPLATMASGDGSALAETAQDDAFARPTWSITLGLALALSLAVGVSVALIGAFLSRSATRRLVEKQKQVAGQWARRYEAADARWRTAQIHGWNHAQAHGNPYAVDTSNSFGLSGATHFLVEAPLLAVANLLDCFNVPAAPSRPSPPLATIQYALRTWSQTLRDLLDKSPLESRTLVIDESETNLRELADGVVVLLAPYAANQGVRISVNVDPAVAETILADHARVGQLCFHLLGRAIQLSRHQEIVLMVGAEPLNAGSQRILIGLMEAGEKSAPAERRPQADCILCQPDMAGKRSDETDACLPLCQALAQRMQGELSVSRGMDAIASVSFEAQFAVVEKRSLARPVCDDVQTSASFIATGLPADSVSGSYEPFDHRFLDSLSEEGVNLSIFLDGWRRAMADDVARLGVLWRQGEPDHLRSVLHRLSGAVGLVGARSLMEALRRASVSPLEQSTISIESLIERARNLAMQLEARPAAPGST